MLKPSRAKKRREEERKTNKTKNVESITWSTCHFLFACVLVMFAFSQESLRVFACFLRVLCVSFACLCVLMRSSALLLRTVLLGLLEKQELAKVVKYA